MAEPSTSAGVGLTAIAITLLGPMAGPYALIVFASLAGALWPLSAVPTESNIDGAKLLARCTLTAIVLTVFLASMMERFLEIKATEAFGPVAFAIGALGNGWRPVFDSVGEVLKSVLVRAGGKQ